MQVVTTALKGFSPRVSENGSPADEARGSPHCGWAVCSSVWTLHAGRWSFRRRGYRDWVLAPPKAVIADTRDLSTEASSPLHRLAQSPAPFFSKSSLRRWMVSIMEVLLLLLRKLWNPSPTKRKTQRNTKGLVLDVECNTSEICCIIKAGNKFHKCRP